MEKKVPSDLPTLSICQKILNAFIPTFRPLRRLTLLRSVPEATTNPTPNNGVKVLTHIRESSAPLIPKPFTHETPNKPTEAFPPPKPIAYNPPLHEPAVKEKEKASPSPPPLAVEASAPKPNAYNSQPRPRPPPLVAPTPPPSIAQDKVAMAKPVAIPPEKPVATATATNTKIAVEPSLEKDKADDKVVLAPAPAPPPPPPPPPKAAPKPQPPPLPAAPTRKKSEKVDDYTIPTKAKVRTGSGVGRAPSIK